jgi:hypothetical protein
VDDLAGGLPPAEIAGDVRVGVLGGEQPWHLDLRPQHPARTRLDERAAQACRLGVGGQPGVTGVEEHQGTPREWGFGDAALGEDRTDVDVLVVAQSYGEQRGAVVGDGSEVPVAPEVPPFGRTTGM